MLMKYGRKLTGGKSVGFEKRGCRSGLAGSTNGTDKFVQPKLQSGAHGYILKRSAAENLVRGIRAVADGGVYLDPAIAQLALPGGPSERTGKSDKSDPLSPREELVLCLTAQGFSKKEIAGRINVSVKSIETYKARAACKALLRSRAEIVHYGAARGWLDSMDREPL